MNRTSEIAISAAYNRMHTAARNQKRAQELITRTLDEVLAMFEARPELNEIDASWPQGSVYGLVVAAIAHKQEAGL